MSNNKDSVSAKNAPTAGIVATGVPEYSSMAEEYIATWSEGSEKPLEQQGEEILAQFSGKLLDEQKREIIEKALNTAGYALGLAFRICSLQTHIHGTVLIKDQKFDISFTPEIADKQAIDDTLNGPHYLTEGLAESYRHMYEETLKENIRLRAMLPAQPSPQAESEEDFIEAAENEAMKIEGCRPGDHNHDCPCGAFESGALWARERLTRKP